MTGKILIVDAMATNRIVMSVRLGKGFYSIYQASSGRDAVGMAARVLPDLVLISSQLQDMGLAELQAALKEAVAGAPPALVALLPHGLVEARLEALRAGVAALIDSCCDDQELQARLRSILRQRHLDNDLRMHSETADALGFAEEPAGFAGPARITVLADTAARAQELQERIRRNCPHRVSGGTLQRPYNVDHLTPKPDVIVLHVSDALMRADLGIISALQISARTRHTRLVVLLEPALMHLAATVLDMGANDAISALCDDREIGFRLGLQVRQKSLGDAMRGKLETGLRAALTDPLTGLYNRRYALTCLKRMVAGARGGSGGVAVMVADLDHFKSVNDRYGHAVGDQVLTHVARQMRQMLPREGMIARIGGEEFLLAVADTSAEEARALADALCRAVRDTPVELPGKGQTLNMTVSIGVTLVCPKPDAEWPSVETLIGEADRALYDSKSGGRDTVTFCLRTAA
ncbi:MAG: diguanylate cyclase [Roseovarius sp.]